MNRPFSPFPGISVISPSKEHMLYESLPYITLYANLSILDYHNGEQPEDDRRGEQSNWTAKWVSSSWIGQFKPVFNS